MSDRAKLEKMIIGHRDRVSRILTGILPSPQDHEDAMSDWMFGVLKYVDPGELSAKDRPAAFMNMIAINCARGVLNGKNRRRDNEVSLSIGATSGEPDQAEMDHVDIGAISPLAHLIDVEKDKDFAKALQSLSADALKCFVMRYEGDYSIAEIAEELGKTIFAVQKDLSRSRAKIKEMLEKLRN